jgi:hypothetical protein
LVSVDQPATGGITPKNDLITGDQITVDIPQNTIFINTATDEPYV